MQKKTLAIQQEGTRKKRMTHFFTAASAPLCTASYSWHEEQTSFVLLYQQQAGLLTY